MNTAKESMLKNFKNCCEEAPVGTYDRAKILNEVIGDKVDAIIETLRNYDWCANNCDLAFALEAEIYAYVKASNPNNEDLATAEGFGAAMDTEARERVIAQAIRDRDFLKLCARTNTNTY